MTIRDGYLLIMLGSGLVAPIIYFLNILWAAAVYPGYRHRSQFISELGTRISPGARNFNRWLGVTGTMLVVFAFGVYVGLGSQKEALGILLGLVVFGLTVGLMALFPCDPGCPRTPQSRTGMAHGFFGVLGALAFVTSVALFCFVWRVIHPIFAIYSFITVLTSTLFLVILMLERTSGWQGVWQRIYAGVIFSWVLALSGLALIPSRGLWEFH